jgi:hypothetical protein
MKLFSASTDSNRTRSVGLLQGLLGKCRQQAWGAHGFNGDLVKMGGVHTKPVSDG